MTKDLEHLLPELRADILREGINISGDIVLEQQQKPFQAPIKPVTIGDIDRFSLDFNFVHNEIRPKKISFNGGKDVEDLFQVDIGVRLPEGGYLGTASLVLDATKTKVLAISAKDEAAANELVRQLTTTAEMNIQQESIKDKAFVEFIRTNKDIAALDRIKILHLKALDEHLSANLTAEKNNIVIVGEAHVSSEASKAPERGADISIYTEAVLKHLLEDKYKFSLLGIENRMSTITKSDGSQQITLSGLQLGNFYAGKDLDDNNRLDRVFTFDITVPNPASEEGYKKREPNFVKEIIAHSKDKNALCLMGSDHLVISDELKKAGKNVVMFAARVDYEGKGSDDPFILGRKKYFEENAYLYNDGISSLQLLLSITDKKPQYFDKEATRIVSLYIDQEAAFKEKSKPLQPQQKPSPQR